MLEKGKGYLARLTPWLLLLLANGLIFFEAPPSLRYIAALLLLGILPGWGWTQGWTKGLVGATAAIGLSLSLTIMAMMGAVYWPDTINLLLFLITINVIIVLGLIISATSGPSTTPPLVSAEPVSSETHSRQTDPKFPVTKLEFRHQKFRYWKHLLLLTLLILLALLLRLPRLGYAEFHEDEAEALMLGVRLLQGEDYALFLHRKGPAQMLLPLAFWLLTDQINETFARSSFALSSLASVVTIFIIGRDWFGRSAGFLAALLWAINGYAIGFGRMVQYQALIFFLGPLALYCFYRAGQSRSHHWRMVGAILLAVSLLAHFDALLLLPAAIYLYVARDHNAQAPLIENKTSTARFGSLSNGLLSSSLIALVFLGLLASFYIPYVLDPEFSHTLHYLSQSRVKPGLLYNNLQLLWSLDQEYSSLFYLPVLGLGLVGFILQNGREWPSRWRWGFFALGLISLSTFFYPNLWRLAPLSLAVIPWLLFGLLGFWHFAQRQQRAAWLMAGVPFIGYVFLVDDPRTHLYIMYPGLVLLAGAGWAWMRESLEDWKIGRWLYLQKFQPKYLAWLTGGLLVSSIIFYEMTIFLQTESYLDQLRTRWEGSWGETIYDELPEARQYFGYPKREGWKAIGALRAAGYFPGDFRSVNEDFIVPIWYNYGEARSCYDTPAYVFVRTDNLTVPQLTQPYTPVGWVQREGVERLQIFSTGSTTTTPSIFELEALSPSFDNLATPQRFAQASHPAQPHVSQFGSAIQFNGYDLPNTTVAPGETVHLNLYWLAVAEPGENYRAFVHLVSNNMLWAQQDDDLACRLPTSIWRIGQRSVGYFRLPLRPDMPAGRYSLIIGLYQAETLERLKITSGAGQIGDDFLWLGDIEVPARAAP